MASVQNPGMPPKPGNFQQIPPSPHFSIIHQPTNCMGIASIIITCTELATNAPDIILMRDNFTLIATTFSILSKCLHFETFHTFLTWAKRIPVIVVAAYIYVLSVLFRILYCIIHPFMPDKTNSSFHPMPLGPYILSSTSSLFALGSHTRVYDRQCDSDGGEHQDGGENGQSSNRSGAESGSPPDDNGHPNGAEDGQSTGSPGGGGSSGGDEDGQRGNGRPNHDVAEPNDDESEDSDGKEQSSNRPRHRRSQTSQIGSTINVVGTSRNAAFFHDDGPTVAHSPETTSVVTLPQSQTGPEAHLAPAFFPPAGSNSLTEGARSMHFIHSRRNRPRHPALLSTNATQTIFSLLLFGLPSDYYNSLATLPVPLQEFVKQITKDWYTRLSAVIFLFGTAYLGTSLYQSAVPTTFFLLALSCSILSFIYIIVMTQLLNTMGEGWLTYLQQTPESAWDWVFLSLPLATMGWSIICFVIGLFLLIVIDGGIAITSSQTTILFGTSSIPRIAFVFVTVLGLLPLICSIVKWRRYRRQRENP